MTNYPSEIDTDAEIPAVHDNISEITTEVINALREALITVETVLGINPQGVALDLAARLNTALNLDGSIKSSALPSTLVDLPITNAQVGASAAIEESKLDLDVATLALQNQVTSNDTDIASLQRNFTDLLLRYVRHINGTDERHLSSHIDHTLVDGYSLGAGTTVERALNFIFGELQLHKTNTIIREHFASAIEYIPRTLLPGETPVITSTNVQDAITDIEADFIEDRRKHNDEAHNDGVSNDGYITLGGQAVVNDASLKLTRYQPPSVRDITKIGLCNSATIKSKGFDPTALNTNESSLNIEVDIGNATRTISLTGLNSIVYPVGITHPSLTGVVDLLNSKFADTGNHFPLTAFASEDGEIVIQHNLDRTDSTITIRDPGALTAVVALGFTDLVDVQVGRLQNFAYLINGTRYSELETLSDGYSTHVFPATTIVDLGVTVDSSGLDLKAGGLVHIYNHDGYSANGTYQIASIISSTSVEFTEALDNGGFRFIVYGDTLDTTGFTGSQRASLDFYLDKDRVPVTSTRANITYNSTDGFRFIEISQNFPDFSGGLFNVTGSTTKSVEIEDSSGNKGVTVTFEPGFIGNLRVFAPDNTSFVTIFVHKVTVTNGTANLEIFDTEANDDRLLLGTSHVDAATNEVEVTLNRRNVGLVAEQAIGSEFRRNVLERDVRNLHANGIVRGFDILTTTSTTVKVEGGTCYIDGRLVERSTTTIDVDTTNAGTFNLLLTKEGNFNIFEEGTGSGDSFAVAEIIISDDVILIAQITVSNPGGGNQVTDTADARFFVNDIEDKLQLTVDNRDLGAGTFRSLESAVLYSENAPNDTKPEITILSDLTLADAVTITSTARVIAFGNLTVQDDLTLATGASLTVFGTFTASGVNTVTVGTDATLNLEGPSVFGGSIALGTDSTLHFGDDATIEDPIATGERCTISGTDMQPIITFPGTEEGITLDDGYVMIRDLDFQMTNGVGAIGQNPIILASLGASSLTVDNCKFSQTGTVDESNWADPFNDFNRAGIFNSASLNTLPNFTVTNCDFRNLFFAIFLAGGRDFTIDNCRFENLTDGVQISAAPSAQADRVTIRNSLFRKIRDTYVFCAGDDNLIESNIFREEFKTTSPPVLIDLRGDTVISNNRFLDIRMDDGIDSGGAAVLIEGNLVDSCISEGFFINAASTGDPTSAQHNSIQNHQGQILRAGTGSGSLFSNNSVEVVDTVGGANEIFNIDQSSRQNILSSNSISLTTAAGSNTTTMNLEECLLLTNYISCGSVTIVPTGTSGDQLVISSNTFNLENGGVLVEDSKDGSVIIANNNIVADGNFIALEVQDTLTAGSGKGTIVSGNNVQGDIGVNATTMRIGTSGASSAGRWLVNGNTVQNGTSRGIEIFASNITITDNVTIGSIGTDIFMDSTVVNAYVTDNQVSNATITHGSATPTNVYIGPNKGANLQIAISPWSAFIDPDATAWTVTSDAVTSDGAGDALYVPLNLPVGVEIVQVDVLITATVLDTVNVKLFSRNASASLSAALFDVSSPAGHGTAFLTGTPGSTLFVDNQSEYFLKITSATSGDKLFQIVPTLKY